MNVQSILEMINSLDESTLTREESLSDEHHQSIRIALCKNQTNMVVGCPNIENRSGLALHLVKSRGTWKISNTLHPTLPNGYFGCSVDISGDAKKIVVGSHSDEGGKHARVGMVHLFELKNDDFWVRTNQLQPDKNSPGFTVGALFGYSLSMSDDGSRLVIGAPGSYNANGAVYVYDLTSNREDTTYTEIKNPDPIYNTQRFGSSVTMSGPGRLIAVSSSSENPLQGAVYCFTLLEDKFTHTQTLTDPTAYHFGKRIKMVSLEENFKLVLKIFDANNKKSRYVLESGLWVKEKQPLHTETEYQIQVDESSITEEDETYLKYLDLQEAKLVQQLEDIKTIRECIRMRVKPRP